MKSEIAAALLLERLVRDSYGPRRSSDIQPLQWSILRYLDRTRKRDTNLSAITGALGLTLSPVSRAVSTLVDRGLVSRVPNPRNAREVVVSLTDLGKQTLERDPLLKIAGQLRDLPRDERQSFLRSLNRLAQDNHPR